MAAVVTITAATITAVKTSAQIVTFNFTSHSACPGDGTQPIYSILQSARPADSIKYILHETMNHSSSIGCAGSKASSPVEQPQHQAEDEADEEGGRQREIERGVAALIHDVAGQPSEADAGQQWPQQSAEHDDDSQSDQKALQVHRIK